MRKLFRLPCLLVPGAIFASPTVENGSFEDQFFRGDRGYVQSNKPISGWQSEGNVGLNPWFYDGHEERREFANNGLVPEGNQVLFIQNAGSISQRVGGFERGKSYRIIFYVNARVTHTTLAPTLTVMAGKHMLVKDEAIPAVEGKDSFSAPYTRHETPVFIAAADGEMDICFRTGEVPDTAVLLDGITIEEVRAQASK